MMFTAHYQSPLGEILLAADEVGLTGLWFDRAKYYAAGLAPQSTERETPPLTEAKRWLDVYFSGKMPDFMPPLHPIGSDFRQEVWALLLQIPYGQTTTYGALAARLTAKHGMARLSALMGDLNSRKGASVRQIADYLSENWYGGCPAVVKTVGGFLFLPL